MGWMTRKSVAVAVVVVVVVGVVASFAQKAWIIKQRQAVDIAGKNGGMGAF